MQVRKSKPGQKKPWEADCGIINGTRLRKWFPTRDQAEAYTSSKQRELENLGTQALTLTDAERAEYRTVKAKLAGIASPLEAIEFFLKHRDSTTPRTVKDAVAQCLTVKEQAGLRKRSLQQLKCSLTAFTLGREDELVSEITPQEIQAWLNGNDWSIATRRTYLIDVRTFYSFCMAQKYCTHNPAKAVQMPQPEEADLRERRLGLRELRALLRAGLKLDPELTAGYIAPILFGGPRASEATRLQSDDLRKSVIRMHGHKAKTRRNRFIEIRPQLRAWLKLCRTWPLKNIKRRLNRVRQAAGIQWPKNCLRVSFCSYSIPLIGARATAEAAGHSEQILHDKYRELATKEEAKAFSKLLPSQLSKGKR